MKTEADNTYTCPSRQRDPNKIYVQFKFDSKRPILTPSSCQMSDSFRQQNPEYLANLSKLLSSEIFFEDPIWGAFKKAQQLTYGKPGEKRKKQKPSERAIQETAKIDEYFGRVTPKEKKLMKRFSAWQNMNSEADKILDELHLD